MTVSSEIRMVIYIIGLYVTFVWWGYLQERITSVKYLSDEDQNVLLWNYPVSLNTCMAIATYLTSAIIEMIKPERINVSFMLFWKPALTAAIASPIGYEALKYMSYPLMILTKSSKPVPVMTIGMIFYGKRYAWYKYLSIVLLCVGISMFTSSKKSSKAIEGGDGTAATNDIYRTLFGMVLVLVNLGLDGYTNNEQDHLFSKHSASANQMMKYVNLWQCIYQFLYLLAGYLLVGGSSELSQSVYMISQCTAVQYDIFLFCLCASVGQVLIFGLMKEFGSLVWITVSVTRKLFTILLSVFMFNHAVSGFQWSGVALVFIGLTLDIVMNYANKPAAVKKLATSMTDDKNSNSSMTTTKGAAVVENKKQK